VGKRRGDGLKCPRPRPCNGRLEYMITLGHWLCHGCEHAYTRAQVKARNGRD
jgi:hypothetical protein